MRPVKVGRAYLLQSRDGLSVVTLRDDAHDDFPNRAEISADVSNLDRDHPISRVQFGVDRNLKAKLARATGIEEGEVAELVARAGAVRNLHVIEAARDVREGVADRRLAAVAEGEFGRCQEYR